MHHESTAMNSQQIPAHDFLRDGSRTLGEVRIGGWAMWISESAAWHVFRSARYGLSLHRDPRDVSIELDAGRFSVNAAKARR